MRKRKTIKIDTREITVKELTVREILEILDEAGVQETKSEDKSKDGLQDLKGLVEKHLAKATDATLEEFKNMAPSEIKEVFEAFREVNAVFFAAARQAGLGTFMGRIKAALIKDLSEICAVSLGQGT